MSNWQLATQCFKTGCLSLYPIRLLQDQLNVTNNLRLEVAVQTPASQTSKEQTKSSYCPPQCKQVLVKFLLILIR